jgi:predicted  nucleic acid-binding Zn-ribbon protein
MTKLELKYNPFLIKTDFYIGGKEADLKCLGTGKDVRLRDYIGDFFIDAVKKSNVGKGEECILQFYGTQDAFEDVKAACQKYLSETKDIKIELPVFIPYPSNFSETNSLIEKKRNNYTEQLNAKKEELTNPSARFNIDVSETENRLSKDKKTLEDISTEKNNKANSVLAKAKEGAVIFLDDEVNRLKEEDSALKNNTKEGVIDVKTVKLFYEKINDIVKTSFAKSCKELYDLLAALFEEQEAAFNSGFQIIFSKYLAEYSDFISPADILGNYKTNPFKTGETIPNSYFSDINSLDKKVTEALPVIKVVSDTWVSMGITVVNKAVEKLLSECQQYLISVFDSSIDRFMAETGKCKDYYSEALSELQKNLLDKLTATKQIEDEIKAIENKIECLDDIQADINKLTTT